jgi:hypothetical protein
MNAAQIIELVEEDGINGVVRELGITRRQAEQVAALARRAFNEGRNLSPDEIPTGTVARSMAVHPSSMRIGHAFTDAEVREIADKIIPPALVGMTAEEYREHQRTEQERLRRERNRENGHPELDPRVAEHVRSLPLEERRRLQQSARSLPL